MSDTEGTDIDAVLRSLAAVIPPGNRVLVIGGYGCGNIGDEAILRVILEDLRAIGATSRVISVNPNATRRVHSVEASAPSARGLLRGLAWSNTVLIGGGGIFSGYMGPRSRRLPDVARLAALLQRRVIFRALGAYSSTPANVARSLVHVMERAQFVSVRDTATLYALRDFGLRRDVVLEDDPATRITVPPRLPPHTGGRVGIAVRRLRDPGEHTKLRHELVRFIDALVAGGRQPVLLPFSRHPGEPVEQDDGYAEELRASCTRPEAVLIEQIDDPLEMLQVMRTLDGIVAMRFHAIVFASTTGIPAVAIPYDDKCRAFLSARAPFMPAVDPVNMNADSLLGVLPNLVRVPA